MLSCVSRLALRRVAYAAVPFCSGASRLSRTMSSSSKLVGPEEVHSFWFGDGAEKPNMKLWFRSDPEVDKKMTELFEPTVEEGLRGGLQAWEGKPESLVSKIVLLDQFTRNIFRGTAKAFSGDAEALRLSYKVDQDRAALFDTLTTYEKAFVILPFEHSEDLKDHDAGQALMDYAISKAKAGNRNQEELDLLDSFRAYFVEHRAIIEQFGRYPHRNKVLGRESTPEEITYLQTAERFGQ